jgi:hypothetical protein
MSRVSVSNQGRIRADAMIAERFFVALFPFLGGRNALDTPNVSDAPVSLLNKMGSSAVRTVPIVGHDGVHISFLGSAVVAHDWNSAVYES